MYKTIYKSGHVPQLYQGWQDAAIEQQKRFIHMKGRINLSKSQKPRAPAKLKWGNTCNFYQPPLDPYTMDTSPGQVKV